MSKVLIVLAAAAAAVVAFAGAAQAASPPPPRVEYLTPAAAGKIPSQPVYVATRSTLAQAEDACLKAGGSWTVRMEGGEKVGRCEYKLCEVKPRTIRFFHWQVLVMAVCEDRHFKFSVSRGVHYD